MTGRSRAIRRIRACSTTRRSSGSSPIRCGNLPGRRSRVGELLREHPDQQNRKPELEEMIEKVIGAWERRGRPE